MRNAEKTLGIIQSRGSKSLHLEDVYRQLYNPELYLWAYGRIYRNAGAMTKGTTAETVDGMSQEKIGAIIDLIRQERYRWTPVRRVMIPKSNGKLRPIGIPTWSDKLLQEVMRSILEAYYEPQFSDLSHGFRPGRGCHTALEHVQANWTGTKWFIEGDIKGCFDNLDHEVLLSILREKIHDNRFVNLVGQLLKAGYLEDWRYNNTYSGTPQGGVISPILANIYLSKLDGFVETTLIPEYTRGIKRKENLPRRRLYLKMVNRRKRGDVEEAKRYKRELRGLPAGDQHDPDYRRLKYIRYADDFILGFIGTREEAETIKERLRTFLHDELKLELSPEKTLVTHAQDKARFLGYDITTHASADRPTLNGDIDLRIPPETLEKLCSRYRKDNKSIHLPERTHDSDFDIVARYGAEYRGYVQYYRLASNIGWFNRLHYFMRGSLLKTLASKHKSSSRAMWKLYGGRAITGLKTLRCVQVVIPREGKYPLIAQFGGVPLIRELRADTSDERPKPIFTGHVELVQRLLADHCECCGSTEGVQVHHVRKLADLTRPGRAPRPFWQVVMSRRSRKTLVLCSSCHHDLHNGKPMRWSKSL